MIKQSSLIIEKSKDNYDIAKIKINNKWIYIGSKYNVKYDIDKFLYNFKDKKDDKKYKFIVFGFGSGEHIKELRKKFKKSYIAVFEPNPDIFEYAENCSFVKDDNKIVLYKCIEDNIKEFCKSEFFDEFSIKSIKIFDFSIYCKLYNLVFIKVITKIRDNITNCIAFSNTKRNFSERFFTAIMKNIPYICESSLFSDYINLYKNKPAIIVSAGPSLDKNVDLLKGIEKNFVIITGGRPLKGLVDKKIEPSLVVSVDSEDINYELMKGCIENTELPLLYFEITNENILHNYSGPKIISPNASFIKKLINKETITLDAHGSVAHSMVSAAVYMGCDPIILIGQDCAYTDDSAHSKYLEDRHDDEKFDDVKSELDIWVDGIDGKKVRTSRVLNVYRLGFEQMINKYKDIKFINATEGGARINGAIEMKLQDAIKKYGNSKVEKIPVMNIDYTFKKRALEKLMESQKGITDIRKICKSAKEKVKKINKNSLDYEWSKLIEELNEIDKDILEKVKQCDLIHLLLYPTIYKIMTNENFEFEEDIEKVKELIIEEGKVLYGELIEIIDKSSILIEDTINSIKMKEE